MSRRLLIISPSFHGYWRSIEDGFTQLGYDAQTHCFDSAPRWEKALNKLRYELVAKVRGKQAHLSPETVSRRAIDAIRTAQPDVILVIRGDDFTEDFWNVVLNGPARHGLWIYDEMRRMRFAPGQVEQLGPLATYSKHDQAQLASNGVEAIHVLNAYDPNRSLRAARLQNEFTFVGARFEKRERLLSNMVQHSLPVRAYGRDWSSHPIDRLRTWRWKTPSLPNHRDIPLSEAWAVMRDSLGTINIHGDQDGFTMRTFEACGVGGVQLIDRPDVTELFEPDKEVLVFSTPDELVDKAQRVLADPIRMAKLREAAAKRAAAEHTFKHRAQVLEQLWA